VDLVCAEQERRRALLAEPWQPLRSDDEERRPIQLWSE
jgi:hypothetical protein